MQYRFYWENVDEYTDYVIQIHNKMLKLLKKFCKYKSFALEESRSLRSPEQKNLELSVQVMEQY